jgi:hypothetical protein
MLLITAQVEEMISLKEKWREGGVLRIDTLL